MSGWAPLADVTVFHTGDSAYVAICWTEGRVDAVQVYGPFRTKSLAEKFGKEFFPRRYRIGGVMSETAHLQQLAQRARQALDDEEMNEH
jgi:hypothetical protein